MTSLRRFKANDLFRFNNINLDPLSKLILNRASPFHLQHNFLMDLLDEWMRKPPETYGISFYLQYLAEWPDLFQVAENFNSTLMGYVMGKVEGDGELWHGHVTALTVSPTYRRMGLAGKLMDVLEFASEKVHNSYFVDLFVRSSNKIAIGMYEGFGYTVYRRVLGYYTGPDAEDGLDMRKALARDIHKKSVIPLLHPITPDQLEW